MLHHLIVTMTNAYLAARHPLNRLTILDFSELDQQIAKFGALRDEYRAANVAYYGEFLAGLLND